MSTSRPGPCAARETRCSESLNHHDARSQLRELCCLQSYRLDVAVLCYAVTSVVFYCVARIFWPLPLIFPGILSGFKIQLCQALMWLWRLSHSFLQSKPLILFWNSLQEMTGRGSNLDSNLNYAA